MLSSTQLTHITCYSRSLFAQMLQLSGGLSTVSTGWDKTGARYWTVVIPEAVEAKTSKLQAALARLSHRLQRNKAVEHRVSQEYRTMCQAWQESRVSGVTLS